MKRVNLDYSYVLPVQEFQEAVECNFDGIVSGILIYNI